LIAGDVRHRAVLGQIMAVVVDEMLARSSAVQFIFIIKKIPTVLFANFFHPESAAKMSVF
jgi:hypothetical protein